MSDVFVSTLVPRDVHKALRVDLTRNDLLIVLELEHRGNSPKTGDDLADLRRHEIM